VVCIFKPARKPPGEDAREPAPFHLPFRGARNYIHSTDLFPALTGLAQERFSPAAFVESLVLRRPAGHQVRARFVKDPEAFGTFRIHHGSEQIRGWLVETDTPVLDRVPFDEETAMNSAVKGPQFARFQERVGRYTAIEQLVVLTKIVASQVGLHNSWLCRIDLSAPLLQFDPLGVEIREIVSDRFITFAISQQQNPIGTVAGMARRNP
jgi:hypothetical protein